MEVISSANDLLAAHDALLSRIHATQQQNQQQLTHVLGSPNLDPYLPQSSPSTSPSPEPESILGAPPLVRLELPPAKRARVARYHNYVAEEETIRNDYSQRYVDGGEWPQNWVLGAEPEHRFEEYANSTISLGLLTNQTQIDTRSSSDCCN